VTTGYWRDQALCQTGRAIDPHMWTSEYALDRHIAAEICITCPVIAACYQAAENRGEPWGVWASYDREEPRHRGRPLPALCGTPRGFRNHLRNNENPCPACREARLKQHKGLDQPRPRRKRTL
jgi:hypothetical protein